MNKLKFKKNNLIKNYLYFFKLSLISLVISICILNLSLQFYETKRALLITLIILFFINFFNLKNYYSFQNNYIFFIYSILTRVFARIIEFYLFLFILNLISSPNISWIITISFTHFLKFFFVEFYKSLTKK
jgi:hypothetical protein